MAFVRQMIERFFRGSNLILPPDLLPEGGVRLLRNSRLTRILGLVTSRPGMTLQGSAGNGPVRTLWTLHRTTTDVRFVHSGRNVYRRDEDWTGGATISTSAGTNPVSMANATDGAGGVHTYMTSTDLGQHKHDGTTLTTWGIPSPTAVPSAVALATDLSTVIEDMESSATWTVTVGLSAGPTNEANIKQVGTNSQTITIAASTVGSIARGLSGTTDLDVLAGGDSEVQDDDYIHLYVRADHPERIRYLQMEFDLDTTTVANAFRDNVYSIRLPGSVWLNQGANQWSRVQVPKSRFQRAGASPSLSWATVKSVRLTFATNADGACQLYLDDLKLRGGTDVKGKVRYTACYKNAVTKAHGNPLLDAEEQAVFTEEIEVDRQRVNVTISNIVEGGAAHPGDTQIDTILLYRSIDSADGILIAEILDTDASPYVDNVTELSTLLAPTLEIDNNVPPNGFVAFGPGAMARLFMLAGRNDGYFSKAWEDGFDRMENWPATFHFKIGDGSEKALAGIVSDTTPVIWTDVRTYVVQGYGADTFLPLAVPNSRGVVGSQAVTEGDGRLFFASQDGVYQQIGLSQERLTDDIAPFFSGATVDGQQGWNTSPSVMQGVKLQWVADPLGPFLLMLYAEAGDTTVNKELYIGRNVVTGRYTDISFDVRGTGSPLTALVRDAERNIAYAGDNAGNIYHIEDHGAESDDGSAIAWTWRTRSEHQGAPNLDKFYAQAMVEINTAGTAVVCKALYDKLAQEETLPAASTTDGTTTLTLATADPEALHQDVALEIAGSTTARASLSRYGWFYEAQPESVTYFDTGVVGFGYQAILQGLWYTLSCASVITVTVYLDTFAQANATYQIVSTTGRRKADRFFFSGSTKGRQVRVTLTSSTGFRLYGLSVRGKPYGAAHGTRDIPLLGRQ